MLWYDDVFNEMDRLRSQVNRLLSAHGQGAEPKSFPLINVYDAKDNVVVTAELPGIAKNQVKITFSDGMLSLSGKATPLPGLEEMAVVRKERPEGEFEKTLRIPVKVKQDAINATFSNGILTITMPKAEEAKPKMITIEAK